MADPIRQLLSQTSYVADGSQTVWNFSFSGGYIDKSHVKAKYLDAARVEHQIAVTSGMFLGPYQLNIIPPVAAGSELVIYRDTPKGGPLVDFIDAASLTEASLDLSAKQGVFVAAESSDLLVTTIASTDQLQAKLVQAEAAWAGAAVAEAGAASQAAASAASAAESLGYLQAYRATSYGALPSDPVTDPLGNAPTVGDEYFNTSANLLKRWNGATWQASDISTADLADTTNPAKGAALVGRSVAIPVIATNPVVIPANNLNIGAGVSLSPRDTFLAKKIIVGLTNSHAFRDESEITSNSDGGYYGAFDAATKFSGAQNADHHHSYQDRLAWASSGTLSKHSGLYSYPVLSAGTITERNGLEVGDFTGAGAVTINTGMRIKNLVKGVNNYALVSEGAAPSYHIGTFTVGAVPAAGSGINYRGTTLTGASQEGIASNGSGNAAATSSYSAFSGAPYLLAGATTTNLYGYAAQLAGGGAGAVITNNFGFWTADQGIGVNNFGYYSAMSAGAAKWAFYAGGTAKSYFKGAVGFGSGKTAPTAKVHIAAGSETAGTAPIKIDSGPVMTTPETGAFEFDGASLFFTVGGIRKTVTLI